MEGKLLVDGLHFSLKTTEGKTIMGKKFTPLKGQKQPILPPDQMGGG